MKTSILFIVFTGFLLLSASATAPQRPLNELMRLKTAHAQEILRYLALGDLEMVKKEAEELERVTVEAGFDGKDEEYRGYGREFLRIVRRLELEATNKNLAGAYYQFSRMTGVCFACHEHMRAK